MLKVPKNVHICSKCTQGANLFNQLQVFSINEGSGKVEVYCKHLLPNKKRRTNESR
jgi:hypothetical protein